MSPAVNRNKSDADERDMVFRMMASNKAAYAALRAWFAYELSEAEAQAASAAVKALYQPDTAPIALHWQGGCSVLRSIIDHLDSFV